MQLQRLGKSKILMEWAGRLVTKKSCNSISKGICWQNFFLFGGGLTFVSVTPSTDWVRPNYIVGSKLLHSKLNQLNVNFIKKKRLHKTSRITFAQVSAHCGPDNLTHIIKLHRWKRRKKKERRKRKEKLM